MPYDDEFKAPELDMKSQNPTIYAARFRFKYKDIFSMKNFYTHLHDWLNEHGWTDPEKKDHFEDLYFEKMEPGDYKEIHVWWRLQKEGTNFYRYKMLVNFKVLYMKSTEIMYKGKKLKVDKGEVEMKVWSNLELDYKGEWRKHPFLKHFYEMYVKRILWSELLRNKLLLYRETMEMHNWMKGFLQMKTFLPILYGEQFHATESYPTWRGGQ